MPDTLFAKRHWRSSPLYPNEVQTFWNSARLELATSPRPQRPKVWGDDTPSNWWGPMTHGPNRAHDTQRESDEQAQSILVKK